MRLPPPRRGGFFRVRAGAWESVHYSAVWTAENPAPTWWAEIDVAWQFDRGEVLSVRKLAAFLGWSNRQADTLIKDVASDCSRWAGQKRDKSGTDTPPPSDTKAGQSDKDVPALSNDNRDTSETKAGQKRDTSGTPRARVFINPDSDSEQTQTKGGEASPPKQEQGVQEVKFGPSSSPPPKAEEVQESPLLPLLVNAGLNLGAASRVINAFRIANVLTLADAATLDEWELGRIAGVNCKVATIKAFRAGGWMPPKERAVAPPPKAGVVIDANGGFYEPPKATKKDNVMSALQRLAVEEVADGQPSSNY